MKITVNLDTQAVIAQPTPLRIKAGAYVPLAIAFTRFSQTVSLPQGAVIEFALKPRNQWTGGLLAYLNVFELTDGNIYTGALNAASASLLAALGISDSTPLNDLPQVEASAEVTWSVNNQKFRSSTFPLVIETPVTDDTPIPTPDPELYPAPAAIALKSDIPTLPDLAPYALKSEVPVVGTASKLDAGVSDGAATLDDTGKLIQTQVPDSVALKSEIPVVGTASKLDAGVPDGAATLDDDGKLVQGQVPDSVAFKSDIPVVGTAAKLDAGVSNGAAMLDDAGKLIQTQVPDSVALKSDIPVVGTAAKLDAGVPDGAATLDGDGKLIQDQIPDSVAFKSEIPVVGTAAKLDAGVPDGAATLDDTGKLIQTQVPDSVALKVELPAFATTTEAAVGTRADVVMSPVDVAAWFNAKLPGLPANSLLGDGSWGLPDLSVYTGSLAGDGTNISNVSGIQLNSPFGNQFSDNNAGSWVSNVMLQAPGFSGPYGATISDNYGSWNSNNSIVAPYFSGDGSSLYNVTASQVNSPYGYLIYDTGWGSWQIDGGINTGWINASFNGDGSNLSNVTASQINSPYGYSIYDSGWGSWQVNGTLNGSFSGDGSGLGNINASQLYSPYGYSIYDSGWGNWQVNGNIYTGWIYGNFSGDGSQLQNVSAQYAQYAQCDEYGNVIAYNYVQQWGYYGSLSVGNADWANNVQCANYANYDSWGYQLYGAGNVQSNFFGGSPNPGDVATFDGNYWSPSPGNPVPITVDNAVGRFASSGLRTGWLIKQLDNRTVYQVLDPNDCATELGWVPVGPFILVPANSTPLVIDNTSPTTGATIHCTAGTWSDNPASYAYQWNRNGSAIGGATSLAYTVVAADDGANLQCVVSATNPAGTGTDDVAIPLVVLNPPVNTLAPAITPAGTPNVGDTLSLTIGTWTGYGYTTSYQWKRAGAVIAGATAATYTLALADAGQSITCAITRMNIRGAATITALATATVTNLIAVNTAIPTLSITAPFTGAVLMCSPGTWKYSPTNYNYQWRRNGTAISGAIGATYTVMAADVGATISCTVAAVNTAGTSAAVATAESSVVTAAAVSPIQGSIASGLIAHWSLDEGSGTRYDLTGNGINLTAYANGGAITNATGKFGMAASIPARSYLASSDGRLANAQSVCGWFKLLAANSSYQRLLIGRLQVYNGSQGIAWDPSHYATGIVPTPGQWYFICAVSTGTSVKLWVNNQSFVVQTISPGTLLVDPVDGFEIGDPSYESVTMLFDEVACWNRALTDAEVATLATA